MAGHLERKTADMIFRSSNLSLTSHHGKAPSSPRLRGLASGDTDQASTNPVDQRTQASITGRSGQAENDRG